MKTTTTVTKREYDADGRMVSETITTTEVEQVTTVAPVWVSPTIYPLVHPYRITCSDSASASLRDRVTIS